MYNIWWTRFTGLCQFISLEEEQSSWNLFSTVSHLDWQPSEVCQSRLISISPNIFNRKMKNYKYICLIVSLIFTLIILISPNFHILAPDNILIYHFINYFYFLPSLIINFLLVLFLVLFLHISYVTRARLSDSGVLISRKNL